LVVSFFVDALLHHATACRSTAKALRREIKFACGPFQSVASMTHENSTRHYSSVWRVSEIC
jgi:hypothetical protein